jgi:hypothetical protein
VARNPGKTLEEKKKERRTGIRACYQKIRDYKKKRKKKLTERQLVSLDDQPVKLGLV